MEDRNPNMELLRQYQNVIDVGTIVSKATPGGIITYANDEFCRISKYSRDELIGSQHNIVRHPDMPKETFQDFWHTIKILRKPWTGVIKNRTKGGTSYYVKTTAMPIIDADNNIQEFIAIRSDITDLIRQQKHINGLLSASERFVPQDFLRYLDITDISEIRPEVSRNLHLTVLFTDIRSFTQISERLPPEEVFRLLNRFFMAMEPVITRCGGFIDKYPGDGIISLFPDATEAVSASLAMLNELRRLNADLSSEGRNVIRIGMGIHTGEMILGTVGTGRRMDTTVIGDTVNIASKVEKASKSLGRPILFTEATLVSMREKGYECHRCRQVGLIRIRGRNETISIYGLQN